MRTYIDYDSEVENTAKIIKKIPQGSFECPKLNPGDMISFDVLQSSGDHILTPVKVTQVSISLSWNGFKESKSTSKIQNAEQIVHVTPDVFDNERQVEYCPLTQSNRKIFGR